MHSHNPSSSSPPSAYMDQESLEERVPETPKLNPILECNDLGEEEGNDVVSFNDIMDACDRAADEYEKDKGSRISFPRPRDPRAPVFSAESSDTERSDPSSLSSDADSSHSVSSP